MKVRELKELLSTCNDDHDVIIEVHDEKIINPRADINFVHEGFDWDDGYVIIVPKYKLIHFNAEDALK